MISGHKSQYTNIILPVSHDIKNHNSKCCENLGEIHLHHRRTIGLHRCFSFTSTTHLVSPEAINRARGKIFFWSHKVGVKKSSSLTQIWPRGIPCVLQLHTGPPEFSGSCQGRQKLRMRQQTAHRPRCHLILSGERLEQSGTQRVYLSLNGFNDPLCGGVQLDEVLHVRLPIQTPLLWKQIIKREETQDSST